MMLVREFRRRLAWRMAMVVAWGMALMMGVPVLVTWVIGRFCGIPLAVYFGSRFTMGLAVLWLGLSMLAYALVFTLAFAPLMRGVARRVGSWLGQGIPCEHCGAPLAQAAVVIASKHCPRCGKRVLGAQAGPSDGKPKIRASELSDAVHAYQRESKRANRMSAPFVLVGCFGPYLILLPYLERYKDYYKDNPERGVFLYFATAGAGLVVALVGILFGFRRLRRFKCLRCPGCGELMARPGFAPLVLAYGSCPKCGADILEAP